MREKKTDNKYNLSEKDLVVYNGLSIALGIVSIAVSPLGLFGIVFGILGMCLSVTYYEVKKQIKLGYILCIIGSLISDIFTAYMLYISRVM